MRAILVAVLAAASSFAAAQSSVSPAQAASDIAQPLCAAVARAVDRSSPGTGPTFVVSFEAPEGGAPLPPPLRTSAFTYDNALAAISLVACGDTARAARIGHALVAAVAHDRTFSDGRIRNAYRAGMPEDGRAVPPGWWDDAAHRWDEDPYQDGTSTGNAAWAALALLTLHRATGEVAYRDAASSLLRWIDEHAANAPGPAGYAGGVTGFDPQQTTLPWKSTEHNIDVAAAAHWAADLTGHPAFTRMAANAKGFVQSRFRPDQGFFLLGTKPDGSDADADHFALDVQVWPILGVPDAPDAWRLALGFADKHLRRGDGMTFAGFGPNRWTEGTAQAALAFRAVQADALATGLLQGLPAHVSKSGLLYATSDGEVPTGLTVESPGGGAFTYFHWPHLGATAWAALAAIGWNPFTGTKVD